MLRCNFEGGKGHCKVYGHSTLCHELCKSGCTDRDAVWDAELNHVLHGMGGSVVGPTVIRAFDSQLDGCEFDSWPPR